MSTLTQLGVDFQYKPTIKPSAVSQYLKAFSGIVVRSKIMLDAEFLQNQPQLKLIARAGSGMDNIDLEEAERLNIKCMNAGEANADSVAEHAMGLLLALRQKIVKSNRELVNHKWDREGNRGIEIKNKTVIEEITIFEDEFENNNATENFKYSDRVHN